MDILIDTSFILTCIKSKIDFISQANNFNLRINFVIPEEVLEEIKRISLRRKEKVEDKKAARVALDLIRSYNFTMIKLNNKKVDKGIIYYLNQNKDCVLASLDRGLRGDIKNRVLTIKGIKQLELI
jgi:rRNA-processing protein FCF1